MIRVQKVIADAGVMSRRAAEEAVAAGRVTIDGRVAILGDRIEPGEAVVELDGIPIPAAPGRVTYLLYKPPGYVTTARDEQRRPTVLDLVPPEPRVFPVGRLDYQSEGLLLLTNDGSFALRISHPRYGITKSYRALVEGRLRPGELAKLRKGVELEDGWARPQSVRVIDQTAEETLVEVVMLEGRKREVRRLLAAVGHPVVRLVRVAIGSLRDPTLTPGTWRRLTGAEIVRLLGGSYAPNE